jgi:hypothetical protein
MISFELFWISFQIFPDAFFHPYVWSNKQTKGKEL